MLAPTDLTLHEQERAELLQRITATLQDDPRIVAAWPSSGGSPRK